MAQQIVSITSQGQVTIPAEYRRKLDLDVAKKALIELKSRKIIIKPVLDFLTLKGFLKAKKPVKPIELRRQFLDYLARRNRKKK